MVQRSAPTTRLLHNRPHEHMPSHHPNHQLPPPPPPPRPPPAITRSAVVGEVDEEVDGATDLSAVHAAPLKPIYH